MREKLYKKWRYAEKAKDNFYLIYKELYKHLVLNTSSHIVIKLKN